MKGSETESEARRSSSCCRDRGMDGTSQGGSVQNRRARENLDISRSLRKGQEEAGNRTIPTEPVQSLGKSSRTKASKCIWPRRGNCSLASGVSGLGGGEGQETGK